MDGRCEGILLTEESDVFLDSVLKRVYLTRGEHKITLEKDWGWLDLDCLYLKESAPMDDEVYQASGVLADKEADACAEELMKYLCGIYGEKILSGQYSLYGPDGKEIQLINRLTGEYPAILGMDMKDYSLTAAERGAQPQVTEWAEEYWEKGELSLFPGIGCCRTDMCGGNGGRHYMQTKPPLTWMLCSMAGIKKAANC